MAWTEAMTGAGVMRGTGTWATAGAGAGAMWGRVVVGMWAGAGLGRVGGMWAGAGLGRVRVLIIWCGMRDGDPTRPAPLLLPLLLPPELCDLRRGTS